MQTDGWKEQARAHWKAHQPKRFRSLANAVALNRELDAAVAWTGEQMDRLQAAGMSESEAWEMVREERLFPPEETPAPDEGSRGGRMLNELTSRTSEALRSLP